MAVRLNKNHARSTSIGIARSAAVVAIVLFTATGTYAAGDTTDISQKAVQAKLDYCEVCHGLSAQGFDKGFYPVPRLAGQQIEYIENELKGFSSRTRANKVSPAATNIMFQVGHVLSPAMITALAEKFHALNPKPLGGAPEGLAPEGKKIFEGGLPDKNVPPCASCHGADAKGNGQIPRIAGQVYPYVINQLTNWSKERTEENSSIMAPIAHELSESQIKAVAAYVSSLE
jgi:cbb3-type cytochrome c oxidase subunit III